MIKDVNNWFIVVIFYPFPICSLEHDINHFTDTNNGAISVQMDIYIYYCFEKKLIVLLKFLSVSIKFSFWRSE